MIEKVRETDVTTIPGGTPNREKVGTWKKSKGKPIMFFFTIDVNN